MLVIVPPWTLPPRTLPPIIGAALALPSVDPGPNDLLSPIGHCIAFGKTMVGISMAHIAALLLTARLNTAAPLFAVAPVPGRPTVHPGAFIHAKNTDTRIFSHTLPKSPIATADSCQFCMKPYYRSYHTTSGLEKKLRRPQKLNKIGLSLA